VVGLALGTEGGRGREGRGVRTIKKSKRKTIKTENKRALDTGVKRRMGERETKTLKKELLKVIKKCRSGRGGWRGGLTS